MWKLILKLAIGAGALSFSAPCLRAQEAPVETPAATAADKGTKNSAAVGEITDAAKKFLATLDDSQRGKLIFDFKDDAQRKRWSNLPSPIFHREGLRMGDLTKAQRDAAMAVIAAALSPQGYEKVSQIVQADQVLKETAGGPGPGPGGPGPGPGGPGAGGGGPGPNGPAGPGAPGRPGGPGGRLIFGQDNYYISFLGQPSATEPWMIQFGGHHLGLNITLVGDQSTLAPSHTGVHPAHYKLEGQMIRPLGRENDKGFALINSLDEGQRKQAMLGVNMRDMVLGPGRDGQMIAPEGIKGSALTDKQREMLLDLASEWTGIMNDTVAKTKMDEMNKNIAETWFAWSGPVEKGTASYFRIQGPTVFIEYAPQRGDTNHIHTIYRDPSNDYGANWWKR